MIRPSNRAQLPAPEAMSRPAALERATGQSLRGGGHVRWPWRTNKLTPTFDPKLRKLG